MHVPEYSYVHELGSDMSTVLCTRTIVNSKGLVSVTCLFVEVALLHRVQLARLIRLVEAEPLECTQEERRGLCVIICDCVHYSMCMRTQLRTAGRHVL